MFLKNNLFVKFENIYAPLKEHLFSDGFAACARIAPTDFTRERALPLPAVMALLLNRVLPAKLHEIPFLAR
jgi:hypothetical protein